MDKVTKVVLALGIVPEGTVWKTGFNTITYSGGYWSPFPYMYQSSTPPDIRRIRDVLTQHFFYHLTLPWYERFIRRLWWRSYSMNGRDSHFILFPT